MPTKEGTPAKEQKAFYEPVFFSTTNVYTPTFGRPKSYLRSEEGTTILACNEGTVVRLFEPLARKLKAKEGLKIEDLTGELMANTLLTDNNTKAHYSANEETFPGETFLRTKRLKKDVTITMSPERDKENNGDSSNMISPDTVTTTTITYEDFSSKDEDNDAQQAGREQQAARALLLL